jgi:DNA-binding NarL/FixJ family response regulator
VKLLIVDGSAAVYDRLLALLGGVEHLTALSIARTVQEAQAKSRHFCADVAVIDMHLADGNGFDALRAIKGNCPDAHVFMFSNEVEFRDQAKLVGADGFYDKSLEFEALVARLGKESALQSVPQECAP